MFKELAPLLQNRSVVLTINPFEGDKLTVVVIPKRLNDSENPALSTPLGLTGTPEELDEQLASALSPFVGAHIELKNTLELAKEEMARAAKAAKEDTKTKPSAKPQATTTTVAKAGEKKPATEPAKATQPKTPPPASTANLFDFGGPAPTPSPLPAAPLTPAPVEPPVEDDGEDEEEEILSDIGDDSTSEEDVDEAA